MYAAFVTRALECVFPLMETPALSCFAEGGCRQSACPADFAILQDEQALFFWELLHRNRTLLGIDPADYPLQHSPLRPEHIKYPHSCYPKNLRRWMNGTLSRKKKCRVEFAVLLTCWAVGWAEPPAPAGAACREALGGRDLSADALLACIWRQSRDAYGS